MKIPSLPRRADLIGIGYGAILFVWLALEDQNALAPAVLGAVGAMLFGLRWILMRMGGKPNHTQTAVIGAILWGAAAGAGGAACITDQPPVLIACQARLRSRSCSSVCGSGV